MDPTLITPDDYRRALAQRDLTDAAHGPHAMQLLVHALVERLQTAWGCDLIVHRSHPVVTLAENYELLLYPPDAAARDARYTRYVTPDAVLRTHTTAMIPGLLRSLARAPYRDVLVACPGLVYRRDRIDRISVGEPHQIDVWRIRRGPLGETDLREMVALVAEALVPAAEHRARPASHPYTRNGLEIEVAAGGRWVELAECGVASPEVLREAGLPPPRYEGLAMGVGLDRALMVRKGVEDIRLLRASDPRVAGQMTDLSPYRPVSSLPPAPRDLSVAVDDETTAEELGDRVRSALGDRGDAVESVEVLTETPFTQLPPQAVARLGITAGQKNVLVRVVLRHPTRTLTAAEANRLRDDIYRTIHEGTEHQWAATR